MPNRTQLMCKPITNSVILRDKIMGDCRWYAHHAAMCLERKHVKLIKAVPWNHYFADMDLVEHGIGAPDEFVFGTTLAAMGTHAPQNKNSIFLCVM